jgi:hypothetical protein
MIPVPPWSRRLIVLVHVPTKHGEGEGGDGVELVEAFDVRLNHFLGVGVLRLHRSQGDRDALIVQLLDLLALGVDSESRRHELSYVGLGAVGQLGNQPRLGLLLLGLEPSLGTAAVVAFAHAGSFLSPK